MAPRAPLHGGAQTAGLLQVPNRPSACLVLAHGAGAGMRHAFMTAVAAGLAERGLTTLRFVFEYMHRGRKIPDRLPIARGAVRAAVAVASDLLPDLPLLAGGKSFCGRMTSEAQAEAAMPDVRGLVFLGFPLHPAGKPTVVRAQHLAKIAIPLLFIQGSRDALADMGLLKTVVEDLGPTADLVVIDAADHTFHLRRQSERSDAEALRQAMDGVAQWSQRVVLA